MAMRRSGNDPSEAISVSDAQRMSGYSRQIIYNMIRNGSVQAQKLGWEYWLNRKSFEAYCAAHGKRVAASKA